MITSHSIGGQFHYVGIRAGFREGNFLFEKDLLIQIIPAQPAFAIGMKTQPLRQMLPGDDFQINGFTGLIQRAIREEKRVAFATAPFLPTPA